MLSFVPQRLPWKGRERSKSRTKLGIFKGCSLTEFKISVNISAFAPHLPWHLVNTLETETTVSMSECRKAVGFSFFLSCTPNNNSISDFNHVTPLLGNPVRITKTRGLTATWQTPAVQKLQDSVYYLERESCKTQESQYICTKEKKENCFHSSIHYTGKSK